MDECGAVGLDLSFASHVFLMEPIADASLEQQARVSHRFFLLCPVVYTL